MAHEVKANRFAVTYPGQGYATLVYVDPAVDKIEAVRLVAARYGVTSRHVRFDGVAWVHPDETRWSARRNPERDGVVELGPWEEIPYHRVPAYDPGSLGAKRWARLNTTGPARGLPYAEVSYHPEQGIYWSVYPENRFHTATTLHDAQVAADATARGLGFKLVGGVNRALRRNPRRRRNGPTMQEPGYPFARKAEQYAGYTDSMLAYARRDAMQARDAGGSSEGWYADDLHTILSEINRRTAAAARRNPRRRNGARFTVKKAGGGYGVFEGGREVWISETKADARVYATAYEHEIAYAGNELSPNQWDRAAAAGRKKNTRRRNTGRGYRLDFDGLSKPGRDFLSDLYRAARLATREAEAMDRDMQARRARGEPVDADAIMELTRYVRELRDWINGQDWSSYPEPRPYVMSPTGPSYYR